jgi:hypothetical protein
MDGDGGTVKRKRKRKRKRRESKFVNDCCE